jgi:hypothetical protein
VAAAASHILPAPPVVQQQPQPVVQHLPASLLQMPLFKRSPAKTPEVHFIIFKFSLGNKFQSIEFHRQRTNSSLDKERDGSSSSETNPPEDDREEPMV